MVMTHKKAEEEKKKPIIRKEDNPDRKFMSKTQALAENKILAEERAEQDKLKAEQLARRKKKVEEVRNEPGQKPAGADLTPEAVFDVSGLGALSDEEIADIKAIEEEYRNASGPGSANKKKSLLKQAEAIRSKAV